MKGTLSELGNKDMKLATLCHMYLWFVEIDYTQVVSQKVGYACTQAHYTTQFIYNKVVSYARASPPIYFAQYSNQN